MYLEDGLDCPKYVGKNVNIILFYILLHTDLLASWSRVLLEKLTGCQLVKKFPHFMEPKISLQHSEVPTTSPYPEPIPVDQSRSETPIYIS
jgi:hypothetical protein